MRSEAYTRPHGDTGRRGIRRDHWVAFNCPVVQVEVSKQEGIVGNTITQLGQYNHSSISASIELSVRATVYNIYEGVVVVKKTMLL